MRIDDIKKHIISILEKKGFYINDIDQNGNNIYSDDNFNLIFDEV